MRVGIGLLLLLTGLGACYQQPEVPRDKPLKCMSADEDECPVGFRCIASGICALINCQTDEDCAEGLICTDRTGCDLPGGDGGTDGGQDGGPGGLLPGGLDGGASLPDAPAPLDTGSIPDAPGGGS